MFFITWNESVQDFDLNTEVYTEGVLTKYYKWCDAREEKRILKLNDKLKKENIKIPNGMNAIGSSRNQVVLVDRQSNVHVMKKSDGSVEPTGYTYYQWKEKGSAAKNSKINKAVGTVTKFI